MLAADLTLINEFVKENKYVLYIHILYVYMYNTYSICIYVSRTYHVPILFVSFLRQIARRENII